MERGISEKLDKKKIEQAVHLLLEAVGENSHREGLKETPRRVANFYEEVLSGMKIDPAKILNVYYEKEEHEEIVIVRDIAVYSLCEHHLLPFFGKAHIAYIPKKKRLLGLSKIARLVEILSHQLQLQERLTKQIADNLMKVAEPLGVLVVIEAEHFCMTMRGVKKPGSSVVTSAIRGLFLKDAKTRAEVLSLIKPK